MKRLLLACATLACIGLLAACSPSDDKANMADQSAEKSAPAPLVSGIDKGNFDTTIRPQDDFYRYVNGTWLKNTEIPADKSNYGTFTALADEAKKQIRGIIEEAASSKAPAGSEAQKIGDLYTSFMEVKDINKKGLKPLAEEVARIESVQSKQELVKLAAHLSRIGVGSPFGGYVGADAKNSDQNVLYLYQSGLGLPDRDYYLSDADKFKKLRAAYQAHIEKMFTLAGWDNPAAAAEKILALETRFAKNHWTRVESRNATKTYNKYSLVELEKLAPAFDWATYYDALGAPKLDQMVVGQPSYFEAFGEAWKEVPLDTWKTWYKWNLLNSYASYLSEEFVNADFAFYGTTLRGIPQLRPRWKRGVSLVERALGMAVGKIYVEKYFPPEAKERMEKMVANLIEAYRVSIKNLDWMGKETKKKALQKLSKFTPKIGYPTKWRSYEGLSVTADNLVGNVMNSNVFATEYQLDKLAKPVDPTEWGMTPQTVNAYYNPVKNEIVFPAAILQPPFFNLDAAPAVNYGGIGAVIGHEIGHGFDDQGSKYDGDGNLNNWWTDADRAQFEKRTQKLIEQYNGYCPLENYCVNGALTIGENIGDLGGLTIAYKAWQLSQDGTKAPVIDGLTGKQRFFMGWAQVWARKYRKEELINRLKTDPHSPSEFRANGVVKNMPAFYKAFDVQPGDEMYIPPKERVKIW